MEGQLRRCILCKVVVTHLAWTEGIYIWLPQMLERGRSTASRRAAKLPTPGATSDVPKNIAIASHVVIFVRQIIDDGVNPACHELPAGTALTWDVAIASTLPHGKFEVP